MDASKEQLLIDLRYAQRLCQRTARLYRRIQTTFTFISLLAGSAAVAAVAAQMAAEAAWLLLGFAAFSAFNLVMRPAEKIAANDADVRKYAVLLTKADTLEAPAIQQLLLEARQSDAPEVEPLRAVAYNDVMREIDCDEEQIKLGPMQKLLGVLA